jgi:hypothetical protein
MAVADGDPAAFRFERAVAEYRLAGQRRAGLTARLQQRLVDAEVRWTRRSLVQWARMRGQARTIWFLDHDFLTVADPRSVQQAIVLAAVSVAGVHAADLQLYDPAEGVLQMAAQYGFGEEFLMFFGTLDPTQATACVSAWVTGRPVLVDDVVGSEIFNGKASLEPLLDAGTRAVHSYPLVTGNGATVGVLSFHHHRQPEDRSRAALIAQCAAEALDQPAG